MQRRWLIIILWAGFLLAGCASNRGAPVILPTLIPTPTAAIDLEAAQRTGILFLEAWQRSDYATMHSLITTPTQDVTSLDEFTQLYDEVHNELTLDSLSYQPRALLRDGSRMVILNYDVTFTTNVLGTFSDKDRNLTLVIDQRSNQWRVAWSLGDIFPEMGNGAYLRFESGVPSRANIYDRNGQVLADQTGVVVETWVIKGDIPDISTCLPALAEATNRPLDRIQAQLNNSGDDWTVMVGTLEPNAYTLRQEQLKRDCDATFQRRATRNYPQGTLAPHIIGHVGYPDPDELDGLLRLGFNRETIIGKSGIERTWDETLRGKPGGRLSLIAANGQRLRVLSETTTTIPQSVWLTLDADLQAYVQQTLSEAYLENREGWAQTSKGASAVVMDVRNGELLALVSYPTFDGNAFNTFPTIGREIANLELERLADDVRVPQLNRPTLGRYPPGSTMKVVGAIAVQDRGIYTPETSYQCNGRWQYEGDTRFDWWVNGHGRVTTETALMQSCNPFFYEVGFDMNEIDPYLLPQYARRLGLGAATGLQDVAESPGLIPDPDWIRVNRGFPWSYSDAVNMAIGQGELEVTPLQMTRLYAAIANGGDLVRPHLVRQTGILDQRTFVAQRDVMSTFDVNPDVLTLVQNGLCRVTTDRTVGTGGTAEFVFRQSPLQSIGVCGKTGTAQAGVQPHSWFIAWAPRDEPEVVVTVMVENAGEGSAIAAPLVRRILEYYYFGPFD